LNNGTVWNNAILAIVIFFLSLVPSAEQPARADRTLTTHEPQHPRTA
jgi:hypothetical protein